MKRKVTKMGPASLIISLPSKWSKANRISKGDELEVTESGKNLIVSSSPIKTSGKKITIEIPTSDKFLRRYLFSPYVQGVDEIRVNYREKKVFDLISEETNLLFGFEIVEQGANYCIIKNIGAGMDEDFDIIFSRFYYSALSMMKDMHQAIKNNDFEALNNISAVELTNNKLAYMCLRTLNIKGYKEPAKTNSLYFIISEIEQIVDDLREVCIYTSKNKLKLTKETQDILFANIELFKKFNTILKHFAIEEIFSFNQQIKSGRKLIEHSKKDEYVVRYMQGVMEKISHCVKEIHY